MPVLYRYWFKEFIKFFFIVFLIILLVFVLVDYLENLDHFLEAEMPILQIAEFISLKIPFIISLLAPAGLMLSTIIVFGLMGKKNELLAITSSGIPVTHLLRPAVFAGLGMTAILFLLGETLVPVAMEQVYFIENTIIKKKPCLGSKNNFWIKQGKNIIYCRYVDLTRAMLSGLTVMTMDQNFNMSFRMDAANGLYKNGQWYLSDIIEQHYGKDADRVSIINLNKKIYDLGIHPDDLKQVIKRAKEMSLFQLSEYIQKVESEGYDATTYRVDFYDKTAFPFLCLILAVLGATIGTRPFVKNNLAVGITTGLVLAFLYWILQSFCVSLGYGKILSPGISAWLTNSIFSLVTMIVWIKFECPLFLKRDNRKSSDCEALF